MGKWDLLLFLLLLCMFGIFHIKKLKCKTIKVQSSLSMHRGLVPGPHTDTKIQRCSSPSYKRHRICIFCIYAHPLVYFKSFLDYLYLIQCKCDVNSFRHVANSSFDFWNFLEFFPQYFRSVVGWICTCRTHEYERLTIMLFF